MTPKLELETAQQSVFPLEGVRVPGHDPPLESWHEAAAPPGILAKITVSSPSTLPEGRAIIAIII